MYNLRRIGKPTLGITQAEYPKESYPKESYPKESYHKESYPKVILR